MKVERKTTKQKRAYLGCKLVSCIAIVRSPWANEKIFVVLSKEKVLARKFCQGVTANVENPSNCSTCLIWAISRWPESLKCFNWFNNMHLFFKWAIPCLFFFYICSFQTLYRIIINCRLLIVEVQGGYTDHFSNTTRPFLNNDLSLMWMWDSNRRH